MAYSDFSLRRVSQDFKLTLTQGTFLSEYQAITPSAYLAQYLDKSLPLAIALGTEKARSEMIICPILIELRDFQKIKYPIINNDNHCDGGEEGEPTAPPSSPFCSKFDNDLIF